MHIIRNDFLAATYLEFTTFLAQTEMDLDTFLDTDRVSKLLEPSFMPLYANAVDAFATNFCLHGAQTIIFPSEQVVEYIRVIDRKLTPGHYHAPFSKTIFQFTRPVSEKLFLSGNFTGGKKVLNEDYVTGVMIAIPPDGLDTTNVFALYASGALQRALIDIDSKGEADLRIIAGTASPESAQDKQRIVNLAMWCLVYVNSPKMLLEKVSFRQEANEKRQKKGKKKLEDYYVIQIEGTKTRYVGEPKGVGSKHSVRYDVIGHPRTLKSGRVVWIPEHQRGVDNTIYRPKVWQLPSPSE